MFQRAGIRKAAAVAVAAVALTTIGAERAAAFGYPTYIIYVSGDLYGTIEALNGALPLPEGACGMRIVSNNVLSWEWMAGEEVGLGPLAVDNNGWIPDPWHMQVLIEFTGGFGAGCDDEAVYHVPAAVWSSPPAGAVALVVQLADPNDLEFLDHNFHIFELPEPPEFPDPEPVDPDEVICKLAPEFCDLPGGLKPCELQDWKDLCAETDDQGQAALGAGAFLQPIIPDVGGVTEPFNTFALEGALRRATRALDFLTILDHGRDELVSLARGRLPSSSSTGRLARLSAATDLAAQDLRQCHDGISRGLNLLGARTRNTEAIARAIRRAGLICSAATETLFEVHREGTKFTAGLASKE